jgi:hypothetical protein
MKLRIENFRDGAWVLRGEGDIGSEITLGTIRDQTDRVALNGPARALVDGIQAYETKKITARRARALFNI